MRIGILRRRYVAHGGGERFAHRFLETLAATGHEAHIFAHGWTAPPPGVRLHRVPGGALGGAGGLLAYAFFAPRVAAHAGMDLAHGFDRTIRQDVFRAGEGCHRQWLVRRSCMKGRRRSGAGLRPLHRAILFLERRITRGAATAVLEVGSRMVRDDFERHYATLVPRVTLIRNGVDLRAFSPDVRARLRGPARAALGLAGDRHALVAIGSGFERKGLPALVRALGRLRRQRGLAPMLYVAGKGREPALRRLARAEGVHESVRILGHADDVRPLHAAADVFVLPTVYDPASNATLEALAMGVPVVTTRHDGSAELIEHGTSGWVLDDGLDVAALAGLLADIGDPALLRRVGTAARMAVEPWSWERHIEETMELYRSLR